MKNTFATTNRTTLRIKPRIACAIALLILGLASAIARGFVSAEQSSPASRAVWNPDGQLCSSVPPLCTKRIADTHVGDRVWVGNAPGAEQDRRFAPVDPHGWKLMELQAPRVDGTRSHVRMIRPSSWLEANQVRVGGEVDIQVPECGIMGPAEVLAVEPCPEIVPGPGQIVTATFHHPATQVVDVRVSGMSEPIGVTPNHAFWSVDRQEFIEAGLLKPLERLLTLHGPAQVTSVTKRDALEEVYNLEVDVVHVYRVGDTGALVHNACTNLHHGIPKFLGGFKNGQTLVRVPTSIHKEFHRALDVRLREWTKAAYGHEMSGSGGNPLNSSREAWLGFFNDPKHKGSQQEAFNILIEVSREFDLQYNLTGVKSITTAVTDNLEALRYNAR